MTLLPLLLLAQGDSARHFVLPPNSREPLYVLDFVREAWTGLSGDTDPIFDQHGEPRIEATDPKVRQYQYSSGNAVNVDVATSRICAAFGGGGNQHPVRNDDGSLIPRKVSDQNAVAIARRIYAAAGMTADIKVTRIEDLGVSSYNDNRIEVSFSVVAGGVPYAHEGGSVDVDRQTGLVLGYNCTPYHFAPPASTVPRLMADAARAIALRLGVDRVGEAMAEARGFPFQLVVWTPSRDVVSGDYEARKRAGLLSDDKVEESATALAAHRAGRGLLAYVGHVAGGDPRDQTCFVVDAQTGAVLWFRQNVMGAVAGPAGATSGGPGGARRPGFQRPFRLLPSPAPATVPRPWRLLARDGAATVAANAALAPVAATPPTQGDRLVLTDGHAAFPALYDAKANLLALSGKTYRPGPALAALLKRRK